MLRILPQELQNLAKVCPTPLYVVGGSVRDYLLGLTPAIHDWDLCAPLPADEFAALATAHGFTAQAVYRNTGTVKLQGEFPYEYACFRSDEYVRGEHVPAKIHFTTDIRLDAKRRDFTANAVYFDIAANAFVDPLDGLLAIQEKRLTTVDNANKVFSEDGLRLLRLARFAASLGFTPDENCLAGAKKNAALIQDVVPERVFEELAQILLSDQKYNLADAPYRGLQVLSETRVLDYILPELTKGRGLAQRADFHKYDVLEHSLRAVYYADGGEGYLLRLAALLHDIAKPLCMLRDGNAHAHPEEGEKLATAILQRLKAPKKVTQTVAWLVKWHMYDFDCKTGAKKLRRFFVSNAPMHPLLCKLKQADFSACTDDTSIAPTRKKWETLLTQMKDEGVPFSLKELAVNGKDIENAGIPAPHIAIVLHELLLHLAVCPKDNEKPLLVKLAKGIEKSLNQDKTKGAGLR